MESSNEALRTTPLNDTHRHLGAKMVPFGGWEMPVQYEGILAEHKSVREAAGIFDVSHMGRFEITGPDAARFMNYVSINDVEALSPYHSQYNAACYEHGGIVDDFLVYRCPDRLLVVPNAGNREKDLAWFRSHQDGFDVEIQDCSDATALIAIQGPASQNILAKVTDAPLTSLQYQTFVEAEVAAAPARIFRTGYTGEDGFEIWLPSTEVARIWSLIMERGAALGLKPVGLGARATLRLEAGLCLYGHEIDETINPLEARLGWITKLEKCRFIGKESIEGLKQRGLTRRLVGVKLQARGIPRQGYPILDAKKQVGHIVSGTMSPTLGVGIGTGFVPPTLSKPGTELEIEIRGKRLAAKVIRLPFYKSGSRK